MLVTILTSYVWINVQVRSLTCDSTPFLWTNNILAGERVILPGICLRGNPTETIESKIWNRMLLMPCSIAYFIFSTILFLYLLALHKYILIPIDPWLITIGLTEERNVIDKPINKFLVSWKIILFNPLVAVCASVLIVAGFVHQQSPKCRDNWDSFVRNRRGKEWLAS